MLARVLTSILFLEVFVYSGFAVARVVLGKWAPGFAILFILGMPVLVRGLITLASFMLAWLWRSPRPASGRIGLLSAVALFLREWAGTSFVFGFGQAFENVFVASDRLPQVARDEVPLLLVHGYCCNRGAWWWMKPRLERAGFVVATVNLEPVLGGIDDHAQPLSERIEEICRETGAPRVALVCHSMGGLSARAYLRAFGSDRVARMITIGTPHRGSRLARLGLGRNARQMTPGSEWIEQLASQPQVPQSGVVSIYSLHDNLVAPQDGAILEGADSIPLAGRGHIDLLHSRAVLDRVIDAIGSRAAAAAEATVRSRSRASAA
ncbi:MAG TPA: alpha/beta fold hydrolase [Rhodocyclaceae bacterium]|nr:alpha/beta fold hydrolase [Rhodocyclaceae bacterium]HMV53480.1 alpha/beta fold hydrolase [Rhodocyclaceae bacterium]HNA04563.1 alpha/beta fold hydrolase [Rhodocyclaceae bacterium]HNB79524.1 alpha/beta fold hydrolase [Rhodocyclaceae bacterium]HNC62327.1 alpha/beta fold hydrolase [Rhodocyclaceae bacterium]